MPLILSLAAPGNPSRCGWRVTRLIPHWYLCSPAAHVQERNTSILSTCRIRTPSVLLLSHGPAALKPRRGITFRRRDEPQPSPRRYSVQTSKHDTLMESLQDAPSSNLGADTAQDAFSSLFDMLEHIKEDGMFRAQLSRNARKAQRPSRPATVLASVDSSVRDLYFTTPPGIDLSYTPPYHRRKGKPQTVPLRSTVPMPEPVSLYSVLARFLQHCKATPAAESAFHCAPLELELLRNQGYTRESLERWASCLMESRSVIAARLFEQGSERPPLFLLLLFLRRKQIKAPALGIIMRHLDRVAHSEPISWSTLKIITVRLLRHARGLWPESMPWIASFFVTEASRLHDDTPGSNPPSPRRLSELTQFCNNLLLLLSLPATPRPVVAAAHQEKAQFQILQYMANRSPAIVVTRTGFGSVARNQLAHAKTPKEREWAELKRSAWPPWKENRTAMDEDKGYEFGASRASQLLHRMHEAGYSGRLWEAMAQVYAGWDIDSSPTIQTRTSLPLFSSQYDDTKRLHPLLWAARIRATRTRREAWACFLSQELPGEPGHPAIYLAMFEKLYYATAERSTRPEFSSDTRGTPEEDATYLLPGDMKEVLPDPLSTLHNVYLSEPVPEYRELVGRMQITQVKPNHRLLAFLLETCPDFDMGLDLLAMNRNNFNGKIGQILDGTHDQGITDQPIPNHLLKAIIVFLCRFGRIEHPPHKEINFLPSEQHVILLRSDRQYLVEYVYMLLRRYEPVYRPAWAVIVEKLTLQRNFKQINSVARYRLIYDILGQMQQVDLDVDDEIFRLVCTATRNAAQTARQGFASIEDTRHVLSTGSPRLRRLFNNLVGASADMQSLTGHQTGTVVPPHIPGLAELHAYVRALGVLGDYEGLYSFTIWLTKHHAEVTARAEAQRSGRKSLFRTLVALRLAVDGQGSEAGNDCTSGAPEDIALLIKTQIECIEEWGGWPAQEYVDLYTKGHLKSGTPVVGGR